MSRPAVFFDRDGTLIREANYLADPERVVLLPGAAEGLKRLAAAGYWAVVVSNQSGVARGYFSEVDILKVNMRMRELLAEQGAQLDGIYYCPHHTEGKNEAYVKDCDCRKPRPGLVHKAQRDLDIDLARSWVVGDKASDIELAKQAGLRSILVLSGYGEAAREEADSTGQTPDFIAADLLEAAGHILRQP
jgi:D-glycero-D-manno-heptose 1,7-bisphosphate phosphatase